MAHAALPQHAPPDHTMMLSLAAPSCNRKTQSRKLHAAQRVA
jgi:hypothetical protein